MIELLKFGDAGWGDELARGVMTTLLLAAICFTVGTLIGLSLMLLRRKGRVSRAIFGL